MPCPTSLLSHPWFVVRRRGKRRLVVDFDRLNRAMRESSAVQYEDLRQVPRLVRRRPWLSSLDLKSAFHHIPLSNSLRQLCGIHFRGRCFTFTVMSFGLSMAPKVWCSILRAALDHLRHHPTQPLFLLFYMDDILLASPTQATARADTLRLTSHLLDLGFVINFDKSVLQPTRCLRHLGFLIDTRSNTFRIPADKASDLVSFCRTVSLRPSIRVATARSLLGKLLALRLAFSPVRRFSWSLIEELSQAIPPDRRRRAQQRSLRITLSSLARSDLAWIAANLLYFPPAHFNQRPTCHLFTDASLTGWGAWAPSLSLGVHGRWLHTSPLPHIQVLELAAVIHAISALPLPPHSRIHLHTDNQASLSYIAKWGGSASPELQSLAHRLWDLLLVRQLSIHTVSYIPSLLNHQADLLSRL